MKLVEEQPEGYWPVFKGESFDIWEADRGVYYAWADPEKMVKHLQKKRETSRRKHEVGFLRVYRLELVSQPRHAALPLCRIAFRDVTNRTNTRTVLVALVPPKCFIANRPRSFWPGTSRDQAFLLASELHSAGLVCPPIRGTTLILTF